MPVQPRRRSRRSLAAARPRTRVLTAAAAAAVALLWQAPPAARAQVTPATHLSCYDARDGAGCVPCSAQSVYHYQDQPDRDQPCQICMQGNQLEWNAQPISAIAPNSDTVAMVFADRSIEVGALDARFVAGNMVSIMPLAGGGCDNGAPGVYLIESVIGNVVRLMTPLGTQWPAGVSWTADPTDATHCTIERPGQGRTGCSPCGGFVAWDEDADAYLAQAATGIILDKPYIGKTDFDQDPTTVCVACTVRGRYAPLGHVNAASSYNTCLDCESGKMDGDNDARTGCEPCDAGTYAPPGAECGYCPRGKFDHDLDPSTDCQRCAPGTVAVIEKSTECTVCNAGQYTDDDRWMCKDCVAGWYDHDSLPSTDCHICVAGSETVRDVAAIVCSQCIAGRYSPSNGTVSCIDCDVGQYAGHNAAACTDCQPGYADVVRDPSVPCEACGVGDYTDFRALNCTACEAGTRDDDSNPSTPCAICNGGFYSESGQTECISCEAGSYALPSSHSCTLCNAGTYSVEEASECIACEPGEYAGEGSIECSDCPIGKYDADEQPATPCLNCAVGTYSAIASTLCTECLEGEYDHDASATTPCQLCPRGRYDLRYGDPDPFDEPEPRTLCTLCTKGRYLDALGSTTRVDCTECEENTWAEEGFATCTQCPAALNRHNTYMLTRNRTRQQIENTPLYKRGATGMVACVCDVGYFAPRKHVGQDWECTICPLRESCPGGTADSPRGTCIEGYGGEWCQSCDPGYFKFEVECIECPEGAIYRVLWFVLSMLFFVGVMVKLAGMVREDGMQGGNNFFRAAITPMVIVINRAQAYAAITNLDADWPNFVRKAAFIMLHMANVDLPSIVYPECQIDFVTPAGVLLFRIVFNAVLYLMVCLFVFIVFLIKIRLPEEKGGGDYAPLINGVVGCFCVLFILLIRVAFRSFDCTYNRDGNWYMDVNPDVRCFTPEFWPICGVGMGMLVIYLGLIPAVLWWQLPNHDLKDSDTTQKFGWLYARYRPSVYFYEWIIMVQKVLLAGATTFVSSRKRLGVSCTSCLIITLGSLVLQLRLMPFNEWQLIDAKKNDKPKPINLAAIGEDSEVVGHDLTNPREKIRPCSRPPPPTREEKLEGEWRPWKWVGMTATEPPFELIQKLFKRWLHCFTYPMSLNSLEVIGLTVQLVVIVFALYFGYVAKQSGECTLDGFAPSEVGFPEVDSEEACLDLTAASGSSGLWTKMPAQGTARNVGIATLALPSVFVLIALTMITINTRAYLKQRAEERRVMRAHLAQQRFKGAIGGVKSKLNVISGFKKFNAQAGRPSSAMINKPGEMTAAEKVNTWNFDGMSRRNSTPTGEPKNLSIETIDLLLAYDLSQRVKNQYIDEVDRLLGNKGNKGMKAGKITQMQLGRGKGIDQLLPKDRDRLLFLQWRLAEDKIIRNERAVLEEERFGTEVEQEEPEEVLKNGVKKMIFVLKFISKTYGPMARNKLMFEKEMRDAQRRTRKAKKKLQSAVKLVQMTSGSGSALASMAVGQGSPQQQQQQGSPRQAWGMDFASLAEEGRVKQPRGERERSRRSKDKDKEPEPEGGADDERRGRSKSRSGKSKSSSSKSKSSRSKSRGGAQNDGETWDGIALDADPSGPPGAVP